MAMTTQGDRAVEGAALRKRREALGLSQSELAVAADVGLKTLERIESGEGGHTRIQRVRRALDRLERGEDPRAELASYEIEPGVFVVLQVDENKATIRGVKRGEDLIRDIAGTKVPPQR